MRVVCILAAALLLFSCSTGYVVDEGYGSYRAVSTLSGGQVLSLRAEDRLLVVFPVGDYREQRALELSAREVLSWYGIDAVALSDVFPYALSPDTDEDALSWAISDADADFTLEVTVQGSSIYPSGAIEGRDYRVTVREGRTGMALSVFDVNVSSGIDGGSYEDSVVPAARSFGKALGKAVSVFF